MVVFSQWEMMLRKAAEVLDRLGIGYALLHGGVPGKERRGLLERFRDDPECRVFLSTDAGGTGLNLQAADTVINLEVPWNPAVLEQRIARVHRMGQHRPVQVIQPGDARQHRGARAEDAGPEAVAVRGSLRRHRDEVRFEAWGSGRFWIRCER